MNPEMKTRWVKALRGGAYKQTQDCLRDESGYCCLGVLADLVSPSKWSALPKPFVIGDDEGERLIYLHGVDRTLPYDVLDDCNVDEDVARTLATKNDEGRSFADIADYIEEHL